MAQSMEGGDRVLRVGLTAGYAALIAVNVASSAGSLGPTNQALSKKYPSPVTPAGFTFAIWGPIFLLQGGGTAAMALGFVPEHITQAVAPCWLSAWFCECLWQFVFCRAPMEERATAAAKLAVLVPSAALLLGAQASMLAGAMRLRRALAEDGGSLTVDALVSVPTGMNAAWLAAASGIGASLVFKEVPALSALTKPAGAATLVSTIIGGGGAASILLGAWPALSLGLGYAAATAWACFGLTKGPTAPAEVRTVAGAGMLLSAAAALAALVRHSPEKPPAP